VTPVATFNDAGLMLQAAEQNLGLALARELLAADALCDGRLVKLSPLSIQFDQAYPYHLAYPTALREWAPLMQLRQWLRDELELSRELLHPTPRRTPAKSKRRGNAPGVPPLPLGGKGSG
jgi:LysR family transcriptional regulator, glycine cleavage system transcriptional activator